jgi:polysaccharide biosynthesis transport protein
MVGPARVCEGARLFARRANGSTCPLRASDEEPGELLGKKMQRPVERSYPLLPAAPVYSDAGYDQYQESQPRSELTFETILAALWRQRLLFSLCLLVALGGAAAVILSLQPSFRSDALLLVDFRHMNITNPRATNEPPMGMTDLNSVNSEMQILQSDQLARRVIADLKLQDSPEFADKPLPFAALLTASPFPAVIDTVRDRLGIGSAPPPPKTAAERMEETVGKYKERFGTYNDGKSFVISAWFAASDPKLAQTILAKHLSIYLGDQIAAKQQLISKADNWFSSELGNLSERLQTAEKGQQVFRDSNHLLRSNGETISGRQLAEVTGQLAAARGDLARKEARYQEINGLGNGAAAGAATDTAVLSSQLIQRLREQEATTSQQVAQLEERAGPHHPQLLAARAALADVRQKITREIGRMTASAANDVAMARANTQQLERSVRTLEQQLGTTSQAELAATQLERKTDADRRLYDDLLLRSKQVTIQREIQESDARVVSDASLPLKPAFPRRFMLFTIAISGASLFAGAVSTFVDKLRRGPSQSLEEVEAACGLPGLACLPEVKAARRQLRVALTPMSYLAASFQTLQNSVIFHCPDRAIKVIAVTSAMPGDGKTTVAALYARSLVLAGNNVLLIDADLRRNGMTRLLRMAPHQGGIVSQLQKTQLLRDSIVTDAELGFDVLAVERTAGNPGRLLSQNHVEELLHEARDLYDVIVVDTPPLAAVDDALAVAVQADATLVVVRWGRTPHHTIRAAVQRLRLAGAHVVGAVLNATDPRRHRSGARDLEAYRPLSGSYFSSQS